MTTTDGSTRTGDVLADLDTACRLMELVVSRLGEPDWSLPTTCQDWDVRELVNHVVSGQLSFAGVVAGTGPIDRTADVLGDDPAAALADANRRLVGAFRAPGALDRTYPTPIGEVPGSTLAQLRIVEQLAHSWDLAQATGTDAPAPDDLAGRALDSAVVAMAAVPRTGHPFGAEQPVSVTAPAIERLVAFLGRTVPAAR